MTFNSSSSWLLQIPFNDKTKVVSPIHSLLIRLAHTYTVLLTAPCPSNYWLIICWTAVFRSSGWISVSDWLTDLPRLQFNLQINFSPSLFRLFPHLTVSIASFPTLLTTKIYSVYGTN